MVSPDELLELIESLAGSHVHDFMYMVLVSQEIGDVVFILHTQNPGFLEELRTAMISGLRALGLLAFRAEGKWLRRQNYVFRWVAEDPLAKKLFERICREAAKWMGQEVIQVQWVN